MAVTDDVVRIYVLNVEDNEQIQKAFAGEADRLGLKNDDDVMTMIKELRKESVVK